MRSCSRSLAGVGVTVRFGLTGATGGATAVWKRPMSPHPASPIGAHAKSIAAQRRQLNPRSRRPENPSTSATRMFGELTAAAQDFNLPRLMHLNSWPRACLDPASNPNPPILERLEGYPGRFDCRYHAP